MEESKDMYCPNHDLSSNVENQIQCQEKCEAENDCVGISYSHKSGYPNNCEVCWSDKLVRSVQGFGFYRRPKGKIKLFLHRYIHKLVL